MLESFLLTMRGQVEGKDELRVYSVFAPSEEYVKEKIIASFVGMTLESIEKQECFVLRIR